MATEVHMQDKQKNKYKKKGLQIRQHNSRQAGVATKHFSYFSMKR